jgi:hypothetical protein
VEVGFRAGSLYIFNDPQIAQSIEMENLSRMKKTQENYKNGLIARAEYLKSMAYRAQPVLNL